MHNSPRNITQIIRAAQSGDKRAAAELLPLVYSELRKLARARMAAIPAGDTLQPTALVHEAYLRLVGDEDPGWENRGHFFGAAAIAMRRILVDRARRKRAAKHGGDAPRVDIDDLEIAAGMPDERLIALDEALTRLEQVDPRKAQIVAMRYFAGLNRQEIAETLGVSVRTIDREWRYIIARLHLELSEDLSEGQDTLP